MTERAAAVLAVDVVDPLGRSGITVDARVFAQRGIEGRFVALAVVRGPAAVVGLPETAIHAALDCALEDGRVRGVRIGVHDHVVVDPAVAGRLARAGRGEIVVSCSSDPRGDPAERSALWAAAVREWGAAARVFVVRAAEAGAASGRAWSGMTSARAITEAIRARGARAVVVTGIVGAGRVVDILDDGGTWLALNAPRAEAPRVPGIPGTYAAALTAGLAAGGSLPDAVRGAQRYVAGLLRLAGDTAIDGGPRRRDRRDS